MLNTFKNIYFARIGFACLSLVLFVPLEFPAQITVQHYWETGTHILSDKQRLRAAFSLSSQTKYVKFRATAGFNLTQFDARSFTGIRLDGSIPFQRRKINGSINTYYLFAPASALLNEIHYGINAGFRRKRIEFYAGTSFRSYRFTPDAMETYNISKPYHKKTENFIFNYSGSIYVMPHDNVWNLNLTLTNMDFFQTSHSSNPFLFLQGQYKKGKVRSFLQFWYLSAGAMNLHINHFGYFIRGGIVWEK